MNTNITLSYINITTVEIYIKPAQNRQLLNNFDPDSLNFTWKPVDYGNNTLYIQLNFSDPLALSPLAK